MSQPDNKIKISWDEINQAPDNPQPSATSRASTNSDGSRNWGSIHGLASQGVAAPETAKSPFYMQSWFYLGAAAMVGAFLSWAMIEPFFDDEGSSLFGHLLFPAMACFICIGLASVDSLIERSWERAVKNILLSLVIGSVLSIVFYILANIIFNLLVALLAQTMSPRELRNVESSPLFWVARAFAWMVFGVVGGIIYGLVDRSGKKCLYGVLGGGIGAFIGGLLFDPIALATGGGEISRMVGMSILGAATGVSIGLVETALRQRWLHVVSGPLAGKQFILYKESTSLGSDQGNEIYLFKDPSILPQHVILQRRHRTCSLTCFGPVLLNGVPIPSGQKTLAGNDVLQVGKYVFHYQEKQQN